MTGTAIVTITSGRDEHLHRQRIGIAADPPDLHVIVGMGARPGVADAPGSPPPIMLQLPTTGQGLPLAAARNAGAARALRAGADVLVFLDVDCIPGPSMTSSYRRAATTTPSPSLLCGAVGYLPPPPEGGYPSTGLADAALHPGRPVPPAGEILPETRFELFWSLSFSVSAATWAALGGFDERYVGYGAEDTDFALEAAARGATLHWVGGAEAYHQHHPPSRDDPRRVAEMVRNANLFFARRGFWPMQGWFDDLATRGIVEFDAGRASLRLRAGGPIGEVA